MGAGSGVGRDVRSSWQWCEHREGAAGQGSGARGRAEAAALLAFGVGAGTVTPDLKY